MTDKCEGRDGVICDELAQANLKILLLEQDNKVALNEASYWIDQYVLERKNNDPLEAMIWISLSTIVVAVFAFYVGVHVAKAFP
jgi:hypothetical protein